MAGFNMEKSSFSSIPQMNIQKMTGSRMPMPLSLVSLYGPPDPDLLSDSFNCLWVCTYSGTDNLSVVPVTLILSVVSMQALPKVDGDPDGLFFVVEKSGLDDVELTGYFADLVQE
jgi:hypothetical protein